MWVLGVILAVACVAVWCLVHLPSASVAPGGLGLTITNTGFPLSNATVVATFRDGRRATIPIGSLPRGERVIPVPPGYPGSEVTTVSIRANILGLGVASHSALEF